MANDTKYTGTITNSVKSINSSLVGEVKTAVVFLATQALDFLMTQDGDYLVVSKSGEMTNDIKL